MMLLVMVEIGKNTYNEGSSIMCFISDAQGNFQSMSFVLGIVYFDKFC